MRSDMYVDAVLQKCELFSKCTIWSTEPRLRPRAWLSNFEPNEKPIAAVLLDHFVYFGSTAVDQMLMTGVRRLQATIMQFRGKASLVDFSSNVVFTAVTGESPNPTDSGLFFCRKARQILKLPEVRFVSLEDAIVHASQGNPVVFLDDFIGSGDQMVSTWEREMHGQGSFQALAAKQSIDVSYLSLVASAGGYSRLKDEIICLRLIVSHVVNDAYCVKQLPKNPITPDINELQNKIDQLLEKYHYHLQLPKYLNTSDERKYGYSKLGFLLAFEHSVPDATLPILWADGSDGWTPLVRRA